MSAAVSPQRVAIIGVGLIGGSLGQALRQRGDRVLGIARNPRTLRQAKRCGAIDEGSLDLASASRADVVVIATPIRSVLPIIEKLLPNLKSGTLVTDAGSVKGPIVSGVCSLRWPENVFFTGSHPLAGSHRTGVEAARADLFEGSTCVIVPVHSRATLGIERLWKSVGARTRRMNAAAHDQAVAVTSHLPHLIAQALARSVIRRPDRRVLENLVASSFMDMTRIAASDPKLWIQIFQENEAPLLRALSGFEDSLRSLARQIPKDSLAKELGAAKRFREMLFKKRNKKRSQLSS